MWKIGDRVLAMKSQDSFWYPATVRHMDGGRYYVIFDDGDDALIGPGQMAPMEVQVGALVAARQSTSRTYEAGKVLKQKGEQLFVKYDNGATEWTALGRLRIDRNAPAEELHAPAPVEFFTGTRVLACAPDLFWYPGAVLATNAGTVHVLLDNGGQVLVTPEKVRLLELAIGERVECRWKGGPQYYRGELTSLVGDLIHIHYEDGDEETTLLRLVRLERDEWLPDTPHKINEGDRVLGCWYDQHWYPGVVVSVSGKRLHVLFDDGDQAYLTPDLVKPLQIKVGDRVCSRFQGGPVYYPGEIKRKRGDVIHIHYDDGDEETTTIRFLRIEREGARDADLGASD